MRALNALIMATLALGGCASVDTASHGKILASGTLHDAAQAPVGTATLVESGGRPVLDVRITSLPPGVHGAHLHAVGDCSAAGFTSAAGHLNPHGKQHGADNPQGSHLGDLPNITLAVDGSGSLSTPLPGTVEDVLTRIFDADGAAVVVHAGPDDYRTDPSGNSGSRIACAVLTRAGG